MNTLINGLSHRIKIDKSFFFIALNIFIALCCAKLILSGSEFLLIQIVLIFILILLYWIKPYIGLPIVFIIVIYKQYFIEWTPIDVRGMLTFEDILIFISLGITIIKMIMKKKHKVLQNPFTAPILLLMLYLLFTMLRSSLEYQISILNTFKPGRLYLYYLLFFSYITLIKNRNELEKSLKVFAILIIPILILIVIKSILGTDFPLLRDYYLSGRINFFYRYNYPVLIFLVFFIIIFISILYKTISYLKGSLLSILLLIPILLTFSRGVWIIFILSILSPLLIVHGRDKIKFIKSSVVTLLIYLIVITTVGIISGKEIFAPFVERGVSTYTDIIEQSGTAKARFEQAKYRFVKLEDHPVIGVGLIHTELSETVLGIEAVETADSGLTTFLMHFGALGILWILILCYTYTKYAHYIYNKLEEKKYKILILGMFGVFWGNTIGFITGRFYCSKEGILLVIAILAITILIGKYITPPSSYKYITKRKIY